ncbi:alpha/beta fold hydrolase [Lentibacillus cibarius]|uniref:Alpha/beta fold hydrolase n=2 Tax=Lentibacillus cibarius TaxID=2583219 RepID=A0A549YMU2_9BACI|nr:alpha/beta fold hydrolase [Lentibacillus cibarius]
MTVVLLVVAACSDHREDAKEDAAVNGKWTGTIEVPNQSLAIMVNLKNDDGWTGTISIPAQGVKDYPLSSVTVDGEKVSFFMEIQREQLSFDGTFANESIAGDFSQRGQTFSFKLTKGSPVKEDDGDFLHVETDEGTLYGEVEQPDGQGPFPVMIIIPGSGPTDRNGNSSGVQGANNSLKMLAERLAEQGIASVRYDKRGVGKNVAAAIPENELMFAQFVDDAVAWTELLAKDESYSNVGIIGHSQGSLVGMLAAQQGDVDTFVSLSGAGRTIDQVLYSQLRSQLSDELLQETKDILGKLKQGEQVKNISQGLQNVFRPSVQDFLASWMAYDPSEEIASLDMPVLLVNGGRDLQVPVSEAESLRKAKPDADRLVLEKMNHVLKEAPADEQGNKETYGNPDLPLADGLVDEIVGFLKENDFEAERGEKNGG